MCRAPKRISLCAMLSTLVVACELLPARADGVQGGNNGRRVPLEGQSNFRDLGGHETIDGRMVKWGEVFRSGRLPSLGHADIDRLESRGVCTVVNFLTRAEIEHADEDRLPEGVREIAAPIAGSGDDLALLVRQARKTGDFSAVPPELNAEIHCILVDDAKEEYAALIRAAADPANRSMVFHCSHGGHRTGTGAAILL